MRCSALDFGILIVLQFSYVIAFLAGTTTVRILSGTAPTNVCDLPGGQKVLVHGGCSFTNGTCGFEMPPDLWSVHTEPAGGIMFGRVNDGLPGIEQKFALFLTTDPKVPINTTSAIITQVIYDTNICLKFWYLIPNQNSELKVYVTVGNQRPTVVWETYHQLSSRWKQVAIPIHVNGTFVISFQSTKENGFGYVGLDSVSFEKEKPPTTTSTTTTTTTTTATTTTTTTTTSTATTTTSPVAFTQTRYIPDTSTITDDTSPTTDVPSITSTPATHTGFMHLTSTTMTSSTLATSLESTAINTTGTTPNVPTTCQCVCPTVQPTAACSTPTKSRVTPTKDSSPIFPTCSFREDQRVELSGSCDFGKDVCGYAVPSYPHLWELTSYRYTYGSLDVGEIMGDHSVDGHGGYMVFNSNNKHVQNGIVAEMRSPLMSTNDTSCMVFWYNMPNNLSNIEVYVSGSHLNRKLIWKSNGPTQGWQRANVMISVVGQFQIYFSSKKMDDRGFLGLDDIAFSAGSGPSSPSSVFSRIPTRSQSPRANSPSSTFSHCSCNCPTQPTPVNCQPTPDPLCTSKNFSVTASCNFDDGPCGFDIPMYPHLWELTRDDYGGDMTEVIKGDHTTDGLMGMYAVFSTNNEHVQPGTKEEMVSQWIPANASICLTFWYNMPTSKSFLEVYKRTTSSDMLLWKRAHSPTKDWTEANIVMYSSERFQIVFSSEKTGTKSYLGVDDITVHYSSV